MRVQVITAHPLEGSLCDAVRRRVVGTLRRRGDRVADTDLYREGFRPAMTRAERLAYFSEEPDTAAVGDYVDRLRWAEALVFCFPVWWGDMPAMLKGYFDRVWVPGVAFHPPERGGRLRPGLTHIRRLGVVATYGSPWWYMKFVQRDPVKAVFLRSIKPLLGPGTRHVWLALADMDRATPEKCRRFLERVERTFARF